MNSGTNRAVGSPHNPSQNKPATIRNKALPLVEIINTFEEEQRAVFLLHLKGYSFEQIATMLSFPLGLVKLQIAYTRKELEKIITRKFGRSLSA